MGPQTSGAVLDAIFGIGVIAAALVAQGVEGAVAEDAGEGFRVRTGVAGEVFAVAVLEEIVGHGVTSHELVPGELVGWGSGEGQRFAGLGMAELELA